MDVMFRLVYTPETNDEFERELDCSLKQLERLYWGLNFTRELTPRMKDAVVSFGERLAVQLLAFAMRCRGFRSEYRMPQDIGMVTDGKFGDASIQLEKTARNMKEALSDVLDGDNILFIPGFYGIAENGDITTFGRGGTDYSAAVVAVSIGADALEIWKDVEGFMSADPRMVDDAKLIPVLSYEEAAELSYFGAKILHPRTVEPARRKKLDIHIKNTLNPDAQGSVITDRSPRAEKIIKSVAHTDDISLIKVHASGIGARLGILATVAGAMANAGINIKSVVTSQTCISLLLARNDMQPGYKALQAIEPRPYRKIEKIDDAALVSIVGEGLLQSKGVAARCFTAAADRGVNIRMISFGPSRAALYFLVKQPDLEDAVEAIHDTFFVES